MEWRSLVLLRFQQGCSLWRLRMAELGRSGEALGKVCVSLSLGAAARCTGGVGLRRRMYMKGVARGWRIAVAARVSGRHVRLF